MKLQTGLNITLQLKLCILLFTVSVLLYANSINNGYVYDDISVVSANTIVRKGVSAIPLILATPYRQGFYKAHETAGDLYRPLSLVMFAVEYNILPDEPWLSHLINILVFGGCVVVLFLFLNKLMQANKMTVAFLAALLFSFHPVHTEVVANIKSRDELLSFFFGFLSLNMFISYMDKGAITKFIGGAFLLFLAFLSKETVISFLAIVPLIFFFYINDSRKRAIYITLATVGVSALFIVIRTYVLTKYHVNDTFSVAFFDNPLVAYDLSHRLATSIFILGKYLMLLLIPYPLISDYAYNSIPVHAIGDMPVLFWLAVYLIMISAGLYLALKKKMNYWAFGILFYLFTIALFSNMLFLIGAEMAERFLFLPSVGFCLVVALAMEKWITGPVTGIEILKSTKAWAVLTPVLLVFCCIIIVRNGEWTDNLTLFKADVVKSPDDFRLYYNVGSELLITAYDRETVPAAKQQILKEGISIMRHSLDIYPRQMNGNTRLAFAYFLDRKYDSAEYYNLAALKLIPDDSVVLSNLTGVYFAEHRDTAALAICKKMIAKYPGDYSFYFNAGVCNYFMHQYDSAIVYFQKTLQLKPDLDKARALMADADKHRMPAEK